MPTAAPAIPPKPSTPAISAIIRRVTTRLSMAALPKLSSRQLATSGAVPRASGAGSRGDVRFDRDHFLAGTREGPGSEGARASRRPLAPYCAAQLRMLRKYGRLAQETKSP